MESFLPALFSILAFATFTLLLSLGYIIAGKRIKGSCGGYAVVGKDGEVLSCGNCPNRDTDKSCKNRPVKDSQ